MLAPTVCIIGMGASTSVGRTVWASAAAARAGASGFSEHPFMVDSVGEPMRVARVPWLDIDLEGTERYEELLLPAIDEVLDLTRNRDEMKRARIGLALALPPQRPGRPVDLAASLSRTVAERLAGVVTRTATYELGHAAGYAALEAAMRSIAASSTQACIVAGVDSYIGPETLEWVEACDQLHGAGRLNNAWGFIPGEAAGALLITTPAFAEQLGAEPLGDVVAVGLGRESHLIKTDSVCLGHGLTAAFRAALAHLAPGEQIHNVFCDLNGETYRADEYGFTALRAKEHFRALSDFIAPADVWGDVGAAGVPLHASLAVICHRKRYGKGELSLVWGSSESGERGAAVIRASQAAVG